MWFFITDHGAGRCGEAWEVPVWYVMLSPPCQVEAGLRDKSDTEAGAGISHHPCIPLPMHQDS